MVGRRLQADFRIDISKPREVVAFEIGSCSDRSELKGTSMRRSFITVIALALAISALGGTAADAKSCHDPKTGKFMKCMPGAAKHCKDAKTHRFAKCTAPGAAPA